MATQVAKPNSEIKLIENQSNLQFPVNYTGDKGLSLLLANFITSFGAVEYLTTTQFLNGQFPNAPEGYTQTPCVLPGAVQQNILSGNDTISAIKYVDAYIIGGVGDNFSSDFDLGFYTGNFIVNGETIPSYNKVRYINIFFVKHGVGIRNFLEIGNTAYAEAMFRGTSLGVLTLRIIPWGGIDVAATNLGIDILAGWNNVKTTQKNTLPNVINELYDLAFAGGAGPAGGDLTGNYPNPRLGIEVVQTANLANGAVGTERIATGAVTESKLASFAVTTEKITDRAITGGKIAVGTIGPNELADGAVTADKIYKVSVTETKIASDAVSNRCIALDAVDTFNIINSAVTGDKIATGTITGDKIASGTIYGRNIAEDAIHNGNMGAEAVGISNLTLDVQGALSIGCLGGHFDMATGNIISEFSTMRTSKPFMVGLDGSHMNTLVITFDESGIPMQLASIQVTPVVGSYDELIVSPKIMFGGDYKSVYIHVLAKTPQGNEVPFNGSIYVLFLLSN